jgi:hypothetical protein
MINFADIYLQDSLKVKDFFVMLGKISTDIEIHNLNFLYLVDSNGNSLLHNIVLNKDLHTMQHLFELIKKADKESKSKFINLQNNNGDTAFHLAAKACEKQLDNDAVKCTSIAKLLEEEGAKKNIPNKQGLIIDSSSPSSKNISSPSILAGLFGGNFSSTSGSNVSSNSITTESSNKVSIDNVSNKKNLIENMGTEVSVDNVWKKNKVSLTDISSEVSIDNRSETQSGGSTESSVSESTVSSTSASSTSSSNNSSNITESTSEKSSSNSSSTESSNSSGMRGGGVNSESSGLSNTSAFVKTLLTQFNSMKGGSRNTRGERKLPSLSEYELSEMYGGRDYGLSREQIKESSNIHDNVVKMFKDSGKSEEEARVMKMALYKYTKDKHPELNNLDRAKKMMEYAEDNSILKKLDLDSTRKMYEEVKKSKNMKTESSDNKETTEETTEEKPKKKTTKKAEKKPSKKAKK